MDDNTRTIGERIARTRRRAGLTQRSLSWVQKIESLWGLLMDLAPLLLACGPAPGQEAAAEVSADSG